MLRDRINGVWSKVKKITENPSFAAVAGVIVGLILGTASGTIQYHDAVTYNNISSYIESLMVSPGLIDKEILSLETPFNQISVIADTMNSQQTSHNELINQIRNFLISAGENKSLVATYTDDQLLTALKETAKTVLTLKDNTENLETELNKLKEQKNAILSNPELRILGENINSTTKDYMATIDGHRYYSEELLNTFLSESLLYNGTTIVYGKESPDRINVISSDLLYDNYGFGLVNGDSHFTMANQDYYYGIVFGNNDGGTIYISSSGDYSFLSFTLGHVDETILRNRTLKISYRDDNGKFIETKLIDLYGDMEIEEFYIPIYNTRTVKLEISGDGTIMRASTYGLANIYLTK